MLFIVVDIELQRNLSEITPKCLLSDPIERAFLNRPYWRTENLLRHKRFLFRCRTVWSLKLLERSSKSFINWLKRSLIGDSSPINCEAG